MALTLNINRESRFETHLHYPDLIQNLGLFRDPIYFNPKLDNLAIHVLHKDKCSASLPQLFHRGRKCRIMAAQCLCYTFRTLAEIGLDSLSMSMTSPNVNEIMVFNNISKDGSWTVRKPVWKAIKSMENFEDDN
ncbi:uncharacterized protein Bfra_001220 [Botrytis fragariae]|uniref:Uncharacterized protein n=1 Tax=Botrytis fragariae TaxID=1964551 RepID=A0A8H6B0I6_9HELO|nr:uncharacterized protein Bfra_001220 [Botrytis fragariae]KAF5876865.1 hypothetical protein Bfra_001220 [Botrytis fragariae]